MVDGKYEDYEDKTKQKRTQQDQNRQSKSIQDETMQYSLRKIKTSKETFESRSAMQYLSSNKWRRGEIIEFHKV